LILTGSYECSDGTQLPYNVEVFDNVGDAFFTFPDGSTTRWVIEIRVENGNIRTTLTGKDAQSSYTKWSLLLTPVEWTVVSKNLLSYVLNSSHGVACTEAPSVDHTEHRAVMLKLLRQAMAEKQSLASDIDRRQSVPGYRPDAHVSDPDAIANNGEPRRLPKSE
jgi:hypothetical protein